MQVEKKDYDFSFFGFTTRSAQSYFSNDSSIYKDTISNFFKIYISLLNGPENENVLPIWYVDKKDMPYWAAIKDEHLYCQPKDANFLEENFQHILEEKFLYVIYFLNMGYLYDFNDEEELNFKPYKLGKLKSENVNTNVLFQNSLKNSFFNENKIWQHFYKPKKIFDRSKDNKKIDFREKKKEDDKWYRDLMDQIENQIRWNEKEIEYNEEIKNSIFNEFVFPNDSMQQSIQLDLNARPYYPKGYHKTQ
jgi:hypothetical protein